MKLRHNTFQPIITKPIKVDSISSAKHEHMIKEGVKGFDSITRRVKND